MQAMEEKMGIISLCTVKVDIKRLWGSFELLRCSVQQREKRNDRQKKEEERSHKSF
jgi:hypothetical protein